MGKRGISGEGSDSGREYGERLLEWWAFRCDVETQCSRNFLEPMKVILEGLLVMDDLGTELSIFCNQAELPVMGLGHQPSHKTHILSCLQDMLGQVIQSLCK